MAAFLTANRWSSGIGTHKTKEGRILCTGCGCIGCFPETNQIEAELGLCDIDLTGPPFRTFLDEAPSSVAKHKTTKPRKRKTRIRRKSPGRENLISTPDLRVTNLKEKSMVPRDYKQASTQTITTSSIVTKSDKPDMDSKSYPQLSEKAKRVVASMKGEVLHENEDTSKLDPVLVKERELAKTGDVENDNLENKQQLQNSTFNTRNVDKKINKGKQIHDSLYLLLKKDTVLNYHENIVPKSDNEQTWVSSPWELGQDAVCFYFALEYFNSQRLLPKFKVLEIVESLCEIVNARDVKCVQRVSGTWQIVLRTRKYMWTLRTFGINIRGRFYQLIDDVESYARIVQG